MEFTSFSDDAIMLEHRGAEIDDCDSRSACGIKRSVPTTTGG